MLDRQGLIVRGQFLGGDLSALPEVRAALAGHPRTVFRRSGDYHPVYDFEWLSRASALRLHHARPVIVDGQVQGVLLLSRSPRALFRGLYEDFRAMAERIERRSGYLRDFAAAMSHEFKTPLAGISGAVELLEDHFETMSPEERRRFLANIGGDAERLSQLVTRLLDLARADMAEPEVGAAVDAAAPARLAVDAETGAGFEVAVDLPHALPRVAVPAAAIERVVTVLLQNARQAGAGRARLNAEVSEAAVVLSVSDDGPGVPPADRERLFEPFFTTRRSEGGRGLCLPFARSLLAASHARLELTASETGARFEIGLPRALH
jgi:signal transduction histidine kinase